jgi:3'(2'), 5'-bisphosphate nucleotidase
VGGPARELGVDGVERVLSVARPPDAVGHARMVVSRSHRDAALESVADALGIADVHPCGSVGLKVALVATGEADLYVHTGAGPKLWDGCAPDAIARAAGAEVTDAFGRPLRYDTARLALDQGIVVAAPPLRALAARALEPHIARRA